MLLDRIGMAAPIVQAPMAGVTLGAAINALASSTGSTVMLMPLPYPFAAAQVEALHRAAFVRNKGRTNS